LTQYPATKAILASGTPGTLAMLKVLQEKKLAGQVKLVGFGFNLSPDVASAIETGAMSGWIAQLPHEVGVKGVTAALDLIKGTAVPAVVVDDDMDLLFITNNNLKEQKVHELIAM